MDTPVLPQSDYQAEAGLRLRRLIEMLDITQVEAAHIMGISKHVLRNWLAGDNPIQPYPLYRLCRVKAVDFNYVALGDWSCLPVRLARKLEAEMLSKLEAGLGAEHQGAEGN